MNEKEAREIVAHEILFRPSKFEADVINHSFAKGYLSAIEKAKGLEEALEEFIGAIKTDRHITNEWFCYKKGIEALAKFRESESTLSWSVRV